MSRSVTFHCVWCRKVTTRIECECYRCYDLRVKLKQTPEDVVKRLVEDRLNETISR